MKNANLITTLIVVILPIIILVTWDLLGYQDTYHPVALYIGILVVYSSWNQSRKLKKKQAEVESLTNNPDTSVVALMDIAMSAYRSNPNSTSTGKMLEIVHRKMRNCK